VQPGQLVVARVDDLSRHDARASSWSRLQPILEESGLRPGEDFNLAFSPERVDPGAPTTRSHDAEGRRRPDARCTERAAELYGEICDEVVPVSTPEAAELTKLLENIFRSVNIALVNELAMLCDRMGIDIWEVVDAAATKPYGFMRFEPGPGMGGHCLPVDPFYLSWKAREYDMSDRVHRARRQGQPDHALLLRAPRSSARSTTARSRFAARSSC
jgi:nucleotide sugar dehydrogenase